MKKWLPWIALVLCAGLLAAIVFGIFYFVKLANGEKQPELQSVEDYFAEAWDSFKLVSYDSETETVILEKSLDVSYEQACSFGKESYGELALGHVQTMQIMRADCMASCGVILTKITVNGLSNEAQVIYSVTDDGTMTACWD